MSALQKTHRNTQNNIIYLLINEFIDTNLHPLIIHPPIHPSTHLYTSIPPSSILPSLLYQSLPPSILFHPTLLPPSISPPITPSHLLSHTHSLTHSHPPTTHIHSLHPSLTCSHALTLTLALSLTHMVYALTLTTHSLLHTHELTNMALTFRPCSSAQDDKNVSMSCRHWNKNKKSSFESGRSSRTFLRAFSF